MTDELHPRFQERRAEVEDQTLRRRNRKLFAGLVVILVVLLGAAATQSALFDVDEVRVIGAQRIEPEAFRDVAAIELGAPLLGLDTGGAEARLRSLTSVRDVAIEKSWSGVVTVEISERLPAARIATIDGTAIVAGDGLVIAVVQLITTADESLSPEQVVEFAALPEISGAIFSIEEGEQIPEVLDQALVVAAALPDDLAAVTQQVELSVNSLELRVVGGGVVSLGDSRQLDQKFDAVRALLLEVDLTCLDTLNVSAPTVPVIVRNDNC